MYKSAYIQGVMQISEEKYGNTKTDNGIPDSIYQMFLPSGSMNEVSTDFENKVGKLIQKFNLDTVIMGRGHFHSVENDFLEDEMPECPISVDEYLSILDEKIVQNATHVNNARYIGHMTTSLPFYAEILSRLVVALNQNVVKVETARGVTPLERQVIAMLHKILFQKPEDFYIENMQSHDTALGVITSGGTIANITVLWCARNKLLAPTDDFEGVEQAGLVSAMKYYNYKDIVVIGPETLHYSICKGVTILGLGERNLIRIKCNKYGHMIMSELEKTVMDCRKQNIGIVAVIGVAGTTSSGNIDPLNEIGEFCEENKIYFHVDAAWGGAVVFSEKYKHLLQGIQYADSITIDGHKQLYTPMGCGIVLFRELETAKRIQKNSTYILRQNSADLGKYTMEGSRPAVALYLHASFNLLGKKGYSCLIDHGIEMIKFAAEQINGMENAELIGVPEINILNYRYIPTDLIEKWEQKILTEEDEDTISYYNRMIQKYEREENQTFISRTEVKKCGKDEQSYNITVLRMVVANPLTTKESIQDVLKVQLDIVMKLEEMKQQDTQRRR